MVDSTLLTTNLLNLLLAGVFLSICLRAFSLYTQLRSPRLFILGLSMGTIGCTAAADFLSGMVMGLSLNVRWFLFLGQAASFGFLFLSLLSGWEPFLRRLMLWQAISTAVLFLLLFLAPILPDFPNPATKVALAGSRSIICWLIFGYYAATFASKKTHFSLLMSGAFLLLSLGYVLILPKYLFAHQEVLDHLGDVIRLLGLIVLYLAYTWG
jgi:hypothetical protein